MQSNPGLSPEVLKARFAELKEYIDKTNESIKPLKAKLEVANAEAEKARVAATAIAREIYEARGSAEWFKIKKEYGTIAKILSGQK
jgi:hypothetical protein